MAVEHKNSASEKILATQKVVPDITIFLPDTNIPVKIRGVNFIVT